MCRACNGDNLCPFLGGGAVSLKPAYRLEPGKRPGGLCLMMLDEAFNAMDDQNALSAAKFISDLGLQLIMAVPSADSGKLSAFTHTIYELDRWYDVLEFHRERSEEHTSETQSLMRHSYAVFCLKKKKITQTQNT